MIIGTVALPVWNSKKIVWLCLESLCRQVKPNDGWELIVFEEDHPGKVGEEYIRSYESRLKEVGCERLTFLTSAKKFPLSQKWVLMANASSITSRYFCLCGADDYYHKHLLTESEAAITQADWCLTTKGFFYDFNRDKVIQYDINTLTGLHMTGKTMMARMLPMETVNQGVDGWFSKNLVRIGRKYNGKLTCYMSFSDEWKHILCTNGLNNISKNRYKYFDKVQFPFYETDVKLQDIVPEDIYIRLMGITKSLRTNDDMG
jgi:hypothetical protein